MSVHWFPLKNGNCGWIWRRVTDSVSTTDHRARWRDWLHWANLLQLLQGPGRDVLINATSSSADVALDDLWIVDGSRSTTGSGDPGTGTGSAGEPYFTLSRAMTEELGFVDPELRPLIESVLRRGAPDFVAGWETTDGVPLEAAWPDQQVAVVPDDSPAPDVAGWEIRTVAGWTVDQLVRILEERS